jgi:hypothetical protein
VPPTIGTSSETMAAEAVCPLSRRIPQTQTAGQMLDMRTFLLEKRHT